MATSRKVPSKHTKSKDEQPAQPVQPPTCTASGRQRCPTEKENYCVSESQHITYCQETKEKKIEKQKKKALRATYNADPDGFEEEPSELHSDIDREEENMIVTCCPSCPGPNQSELSPYYTSEWTCIISRMIRASGPWAHGRNILVDDGWAGRNIIPNDSGVDEWADVHEYPVDGWAEVVGYHVDGCIKVDVYQIDRRVGQGVVQYIILDGWAEGGIKYRWVGPCV
ncbi:hypothetical protein BDR07DRAFT_1378340 [Suillus spraguei]|nr:hypothetical protein BDR07DRAFT_1378340 [Suillus spraguei]